MFEFGQVKFVVLDVVLDTTRGSNQDIDAVADKIDWREEGE